MSEITNPPLEPSRGVQTANASAHTSGPIVNPPLDDAGAGSTMAPDFRNPPLDDDAGIGALNPPPDEADIERWFEAQLEQGAPTATPPKKRAAKRSATRRTTSKSSAKKKTSRRQFTSKE